MELAEQLVALRKAKGWTQAEAAKNISIQQSYLSKLENGLFVPSDEVIEKLCSAYGVSKSTLTRNKSLSWRFISESILIPLLGIFFLISGYSALLFSTTYYTYKTEPLEQSESVELYLDYHLSDEYLGEKFISEQSGTRYHFSLIASREVNRQENKFQIILGIILLLISIGTNFNRLIRTVKPSNTGSN